MAARRMFTDKIIESDAFLEMPLSSQALYFHYCMNADDDGFVNNPTRIQRMIGAAVDDDKVLIAKAFVLPFQSGIKVIKHWRMHNLLRKDRYTETEYTEEKSMLYIKENGAYTFDSKQGKPLLATKWQPNGTQRLPQVSIGKDSIGKDNLNLKDIVVDKNITRENDDDTTTSTTDRLKENLETFCNRFGVVVDNYNSILADMDFKTLTERFEESSWLQTNISSLKKVCDLYPKIIAGHYKDYTRKPRDDSYDILDKMLKEAKEEEKRNGETQ